MRLNTKMQKILHTSHVSAFARSGACGARIIVVIVVEVVVAVVVVVVVVVVVAVAVAVSVSVAVAVAVAVAVVVVVVVVIVVVVVVVVVVAGPRPLFDAVFLCMWLKWRHAECVASAVNSWLMHSRCICEPSHTSHLATKCKRIDTKEAIRT